MAAVFLWLTLGVALSALRPLKRFGLRTLFIILTLAAVALGLGVLLVRGR
jgi:hypothetical protein